MTTGPRERPAHEVPRVAPRRATTLALTSGALMGALCFAIAVVADLAGGGGSSAGSIAGDRFLAALLELSPHAWAVLGCAVVIATPPIGLVTTAFEFHAIADRRGVLIALTVLGVFGASLLIALIA